MPSEGEQKKVPEDDFGDTFGTLTNEVEKYFQNENEK